MRSRNAATAPAWRPATRALPTDPITGTLVRRWFSSPKRTITMNSDTPCPVASRQLCRSAALTESPARTPEHQSGWSKRHTTTTIDAVINATITGRTAEILDVTMMFVLLPMRRINPVLGPGLLPSLGPCGASRRTRVVARERIVRRGRTVRRCGPIGSRSIGGSG